MHGATLLGLSLFLSFGLTAMGLPALAVVLVHARGIGWPGVVRVLAAGAVGVVLVVGLFALGGYWWFEGLSVDTGRVKSGPRAQPESSAAEARVRSAREKADLFIPSPPKPRPCWSPPCAAASPAAPRRA